MLEDHSSGEDCMVENLLFARRYLLRLANGLERATAIPLPGSATYANEAAIRTFVPAGGKLLVHSNGAYGDWLLAMCRAMGTPYTALRTSPTQPPQIERFRQALLNDPQITHVILVHCETSSGLLNPIDEIAELCRDLGKGLLIDAVATFGALELDIKRLQCQALVLSSNKGLEGPPGLAWVIADRAILEACKDNARSLSLDLWDQNQHMDRANCFRFTPPTHVVAAVAEALRRHEAEGGAQPRLRKYQRNWRCLVDRMREIGFETLLSDDVAAPIVATFHNPSDPGFSFQNLYEEMARRGLIIFPGRLAVQNTFWIGCMGAVSETEMTRAADAIQDILKQQGVREFGTRQFHAA
jgi:2-aminoethylphosphonate-pyruvate transaminase